MNASLLHTGVTLLHIHECPGGARQGDEDGKGDESGGKRIWAVLREAATATSAGLNPATSLTPKVEDRKPASLKPTVLPENSSVGKSLRLRPQEGSSMILKAKVAALVAAPALALIATAILSTAPAQASLAAPAAYGPTICSATSAYRAIAETVSPKTSLSG
jgi:hypothetical protein